MSDRQPANAKRAPGDTPRAAPDVGGRLRAVREARGLSLRGLAERCGLSINTISLIERGANSPTVASLHVLATALGVPITEFFRAASDEKAVHVKRNLRVTYRRGGMEIESLGAGLPDQHLEPFLVTIGTDPDDDQSQPIVHNGQEFVYCVDGQIDYQVGEGVYRLEAGDSLLFEASQPHRFWNSGRRDAVVLLVFSARDSRDTGRKEHIGG